MSGDHATRSTHDSAANRTRLLVAVTDSMALLLLRGQLRAAREAGFDVTVLSSPGEAGERIAAAEGVLHVTVPMARSIAPVADLVALARIIGHVRALDPHIIDAGTPKAGLLLMLAGWLCRVPCRIHTLRGLRSESARGLRRTLLHATTRLTTALAHRVICISPSLRDQAVAMGVLRAQKTVVLGAGSSNGVDLARFTRAAAHRAEAAGLRARLGIPETAPVLGFVGRIARDKGIVELAAAWRVLGQKHPELHLVLVGPEDPTDPVPAAVLASLRGDARVHFLGRFDNVVPAYLAMDVLALPTYREGFGNVLLEAAALQVPVVATAVTGCVDAVTSGETGILVAPRDSAALARAISAYLADPELRAAHGRAARTRVQALFDQNALWARLHAEYRRCRDR